MNEDFVKSLQDTQQNDQIRAALKNLAAVVGEYHIALREQGFVGNDVTALLLQFQHAMLRHSLDQGKPKP